MKQEIMELERYELQSGPAYRFDLDRRGFFRALGAGIAVVVAASNGEAQESGGRRGGGREALPRQIGAWLHIGENGAITVFTGKAEVGQNIRTSLAQAVAG
ncbi:MAG: molybdopterin cofactor-binding domain-containing protein, partial [Pseudomonadota bacterium]